MADDSVIDFSAAQRLAAARRTGSGDDDTSGKAFVRVAPGRQHEIAEATENALFEANVPYYRFGTRLVVVRREAVRVAGGVEERTPRIVHLNPEEVLRDASRVIVYLRRDKQGDWIRCDCPEKIPGMIVKTPSSRFPALLGVVNAPVLRADGSLLTEPGYDAASGLIYDPGDVEFPPVARRPTKKEALRARDILWRALRLYTFVDDIDKSVVLSAILTTMTRFSLPTAPMHAIDASTAAAGKGLIVGYVSIIATGTTPRHISYTDEVEFEKRLDAKIIAGAPIISIDNVEVPFASARLCTMLSETMMSVRAFGTLDDGTYPSVAAVMTTGNNLQVVGDLTRRTLIARIRVQVERPELEEYSFKPTTQARRHRPVLVWAALTILRAYMTSGERAKVSPLGSYEEWSRLVREAIVWLGWPDPVATTDRARREDPKLRHLQDILTAWMSAFDDPGAIVTTREIINLALSRWPSDQDGKQGNLKHPTFRDALRAVAVERSRDEINPDRLGWWLRRNKERFVKVNDVQVKIVQNDELVGPARWQLVTKDDRPLPLRLTPPTDDSEPPF